MHPPRPLQALGLLTAAVTATVALWVASSPPATWTVAPGAVGLR
jgi:hypothetical protein